MNDFIPMIELFPRDPSKNAWEKKLYLAILKVVKRYGSLNWNCISKEKVPSSEFATYSADLIFQTALATVFSGFVPRDWYETEKRLEVMYYWGQMYFAIKICNEADFGGTHNIVQDNGWFGDVVPVWKKWVCDFVEKAKIDPCNALATLKEFSSALQAKGDFETYFEPVIEEINTFIQ
jgi:hypothetical protein